MSLTLLFARYLLVRLTMRARRTGLIATKRIFIVGTGYHIGEIIRQYQPWELGASIVGCRFLTPAPNTASPQMRSDCSTATSTPPSRVRARSSPTPS